MKRFGLAMLAAALFLAFAMPGTARAAVETYTLEKPHTQIMFFVDHQGFSKSQGKFLDYEGTIQFDRENPANSSANVTIKTASIFMGTDAWDAHLKNEDFFNVEKYPEMIFKSTGVNVTGENTAQIAGDLTILGVSKPVTLDVVFNKAGPRPMGDKYSAGFSATTKIKRSDYGMNYGIPIVGDDVEIRIEVEADRDRPASAEEKAQ